MLVAMGTVGMATPEAVLAKLVAVALLTSVTKPHHALAPAVGAFHWMEDWTRQRWGALMRSQRITTHTLSLIRIILCCLFMCAVSGSEVRVRFMFIVLLVQIVGPNVKSRS